MRTGLLGLTLAALTLPAAAQTLDEVRQAVDDYFGEDDVTQRSHASLKGWGNAALPFLRELAGTPKDLWPLERLAPVRRGDWALVCSVRALDTPEAIEFLVEILDGKTAVGAPQALDVLQNMTGSGHELRSHLRFQQLVFKFAKDSSGVLAGHSRGVAARIIADCQWEDGEPLLELMLQDEDLSLREDAAKALAELTGRHVEVRRPALSFPHAAPREDLVLLANLGNETLGGRLDTWFDGQPALIRDSGTNLAAGGRDGFPREIVDPGFDVADILSLPSPDGGLRWILLGDDVGADWSFHPALAVCVDRERHELWRYRPEKAGLEAMCRLYAVSGCIGVAFGPGSKEGVVAFDPEGHELFRVPFKYVTYELASHPRLPGLWLHCGGQLTLYDNAGKPVGQPHTAPWHGLPSGGFLYSSHAVLATDEAGEAVIIAAGSGHKSEEAIVRCDADLHEVWRARMTADVEALVLLEPPGRETLVAATTRTGELLVFDIDGGLQQQIAMPSGRSGKAEDSVSTYSISAGPLPDGGYGLAVGLLSNTLLYEVR